MIDSSSEKCGIKNEWIILYQTLNIITHVIVGIRALPLVENGVNFRYIHFRLIFKMAASRFVNVSEKEINIMKENAIPISYSKICNSSKWHFKG